MCSFGDHVRLGGFCSTVQAEPSNSRSLTIQADGPTSESALRNSATLKPDWKWARKNATHHGRLVPNRASRRQPTSVRRLAHGVQRCGLEASWLTGEDRYSAGTDAAAQFIRLTAAYMSRSAQLCCCGIQLSPFPISARSCLFTHLRELPSLRPRAAASCRARSLGLRKARMSLPGVGWMTAAILELCQQTVVSFEFHSRFHNHHMSTRFTCNRLVPTVTSFGRI